VVETVGLIAGSSVLGGIATKVADYLINKNKAEADTEKTKADEAAILTKIALDLVQPLEKRIETLESENEDTKKKLTDAIQHIYELRCWITINVPDKVAPVPPASLGI